MRPFLRSTNYLGCYCTSPTRLQILSFGHGNGLSPVWWLENKAGLSPIYRIPCPIFSHEPESDNGRFLQYLSGSVYAKFHFLLALIAAITASGSAVIRSSVLVCIQAPPSSNRSSRQTVPSNISTSVTPFSRSISKIRAEG